MNYNCPNCSSNNTQKLRLVYEMGTSNISGKTTAMGVGLSAGGVGLGASSGNFEGVESTLLSKDAKPPELNITGKIGCGYFLLFLFILFFIIALSEHTSSTTYYDSFYIVLFCFAMVGVIGIILIGVGKGELLNAKEKHKKELEEYEKLFICLRCGTKFNP